MWKLCLLVLAILAYLGTSNGMSTCFSNCTCVEEECRLQFSLVLQKIVGNEKPTCRELHDYIVCLEPCEEAKPGATLNVMFDTHCTNSTDGTTQSPHVANKYLNIFSIATSGSPPIDPAALQSLENCTALVQCMPEENMDLSRDNVTAYCGVADFLFECMTNATTSCTIPEQVSSLMVTARQRMESHCSPGEILMDNAIESLLVRVFNSSGISIDGTNSIHACGVLTDCRKSKSFGTGDISGEITPTKRLCQFILPLYQCVNDKLNQQQCGVSEKVKSTFGWMTGYVAIACMGAIDSSETRSSGVDQVFVQMLKGDVSEGLAKFTTPGCEALFRCAAQAESNTMQAMDDENLCSNLQATNQCVDDNVDSCVMASHFQEIFEQAREMELENCLAGAVCLPAYSIGMLLGIACLLLVCFSS